MLFKHKLLTPADLDPDKTLIFFKESPKENIRVSRTSRRNIIFYQLQIKHPALFAGKVHPAFLALRDSFFELYDIFQTRDLMWINKSLNAAAIHYKQCFDQLNAHLPEVIDRHYYLRYILMPHELFPRETFNWIDSSACFDTLTMLAELELPSALKQSFQHKTWLIEHYREVFEDTTLTRTAVHDTNQDFITAKETCISLFTHPHRRQIMQAYTDHKHHLADIPRLAFFLREYLASPRHEAMERLTLSLFNPKAKQSHPARQRECDSHSDILTAEKEGLSTQCCTS